MAVISLWRSFFMPMKYLMLLTIPFFFACNQSKEVSQDNSGNTATKEESVTKKETNNVVNYIGTVKIPKDNCPYVEAQLKDGKTYKVYVINLDEKFLQDGTKIKFEYAISRMMIPGNCTADITAKFYNVYRVR